MDAMKFAKRKLAQLWQAPLLLISIGLFVYAAILFINPKGKPTVSQQLEVAAELLKQDRPEKAVDQLNLLLEQKPDKLQEGAIHLLLATAIEGVQKQRHISVPDNHWHIIQQTRFAEDCGVKIDADGHRRVAESMQALGQLHDAIEHYRLAIKLDPARIVSLQRKIIELQLVKDPVGAALSLEDYRRRSDLSPTERAWALSEQAHLAINASQFADARRLLDEAMPLAMSIAQARAQGATADTRPLGMVWHWMGYCSWMMKDRVEAERQFRQARNLFKLEHPLDAEACWYLGQILEDRGQMAEAAAFYEAILTSHPDAPVATLARLGRGVCRIAAGEHDAGLTDLHDVVGQVGQRESKSSYKPQTIAGLQQAAGLLATKFANYQGAIEVLAYEQQLAPEPPPTFYERLGKVYEKRAQQIEAELADERTVEKVRRQQQVRDLRTKAGDAYIAYSKALTVDNDKTYRDAMWKGIELYDSAGDLQRVISALELFALERPEDSLAPDALLRLGQAYQAAGMFDKAIATYQRNRFQYPNSMGASKSAVPLALAYIAKGSNFYAKAQTVLESVISDNPLLTPEAGEFRQAMFELAQLYYRTGRYEDAIAKLEEFTQRYQNEEKLGQLLFLMADSYRKSAAELETRLATSKTADASGKLPDLAEMLKAKKERLGKARQLYDRTIDYFKKNPPTIDLDRQYLKYAYFYRADCEYDLANYPEAVSLYDAAAFLYQDDPSALAAYVQIVNANCAMGKHEEAKAANERAKWLVKRINPQTLGEGNVSMPKQYWEQWLKWSGDAGMW